MGILPLDRTVKLIDAGVEGGFLQVCRNPIQLYA